MSAHNHPKCCRAKPDKRAHRSDVSEVRSPIGSAVTVRQRAFRPPAVPIVESGRSPVDRSTDRVFLDGCVPSGVARPFVTPLTTS